MILVPFLPMSALPPKSGCFYRIIWSPWGLASGRAVPAGVLLCCSQLSSPESNNLKQLNASCSRQLFVMPNHTSVCLQSPRQPSRMRALVSDLERRFQIPTVDSAVGPGARRLIQASFCNCLPLCATEHLPPESQEGLHPTSSAASHISCCCGCRVCPSRTSCRRTWGTRCISSGTRTVQMLWSRGRRQMAATSAGGLHLCPVATDLPVPAFIAECASEVAESVAHRRDTLVHSCRESGGVSWPESCTTLLMARFAYGLACSNCHASP